MNEAALPEYAHANMVEELERLDEERLDKVGYGVIGFDAETVVRRYNDFESKLAGISKERAIGHAFFTVVAPCMNNYMVALKFEDALASNTALDATIKYVLTLRMRATNVTLRLLVAPNVPTRYILVDWHR